MRRLCGIEVPRDLSLATFSDYVAHDAGPEISTWLVPFAGVGEAAADLALTLVASGRQQPAHCVPISDVVGNTIAPPSG